MAGIYGSACRAITRRRLRIPAALVAILTIGVATSLASQLQQFIGKKVVKLDIVVEGAPSSDTTELRDVIAVRPEQLFSPVRIHDSLYRLFRSGLVSSARVEAEASGLDGVVIRFIVRPQARIDTVIFQGNPVFSTRELQAHVNQLNAGDKLTAGVVLRGVNNLQTFYATHGYYQAQITSDLKLDPTGTRATVIYTINAGSAARISKLTVAASGAHVDIPGAKLPLAVGKTFTDTGLQDEMSAITQAYLAKDYLAVQTKSSVVPDAAANTVAVAINIDSGPLADVRIDGMTVNDKQKHQIFPFYTQGGLDEFSLEDGRRRLLDFAQRQGYFFAEVTGPPKPDLSQSRLTLTYVVDPGNRYRLSDLDIKGLNAIPVKDLTSELKSKQATSIPFTAAKRGITSNDYLRDDTNRILRRLYDLGYRRAHVDALRGVSPRGDDLIITFDVRQGPRTYIEGVGVKGNMVLTSAQLLKRTTLKPNDPLETSTVNANSNLLLTAYNQMGYADAQVNPEIEDEGNSDGEDRVRLLYNVTEGPRIKILHIETHGAGITSEKRLEKDFYLFRSGDFLRNDKLAETERALYDTNAFTSVTIHSQPVGRTPTGIQERDVTVDVAEAKRYLLIYGFGFQSTNGNPTVPGLGFLHGAEGLVQLTDTNLLGKLYSGSIQFRVSPTEALGQISFEDPRPFGINLPVVISVFAQRLAELSFSSNRYTAQIQFEKRLSQNTIVYFSYNFERISVFNLNPQLLETNDIQQVLAIEQEQKGLSLGRIGPNFLRDTRDNAFDPTKGTLTTGSLSIAADFLGGSAAFVKALMEHDRYYPLGIAPGLVYSVSGRLGLATPFGSSGAIPISEKFFAGGPRDLRGLGFELAGPLDPKTGLPLGGNALLVVNNELRFPIWNFIGGAVFSDTGNVFARVRDIVPANFTESLGFGLRIKTPIGPLRVDMGFPVFNKPPGQRDYRVHLSFGQTF